MATHSKLEFTTTGSRLFCNLSKTDRTRFKTLLELAREPVCIYIACNLCSYSAPGSAGSSIRPLSLTNLLVISPPSPCDPAQSRCSELFSLALFLSCTSPSSWFSSFSSFFRSDEPLLHPPTKMNSIQFVHYIADDSSQTDRYYQDGKASQSPIQADPSLPLKTPRPMNSWILFRAQMLREFKEADPTFRQPQGVMSKVTADLWRNATPETKAAYNALADQKRIEHATKYPHYKLKPKPKKGLKSKYPSSRSSSISSTASNESNNITISRSSSYSQPSSTYPASSSSSSFSSPSSTPLCSPTYTCFNPRIWNDPATSPTLMLAVDHYSSPACYTLPPPSGENSDLSWSANWAFNEDQGWEPVQTSSERWDSRYELSEQPSGLVNWDAL